MFSDLMVRGGIMMIPLAALSVLTVSIALEKAGVWSWAWVSGMAPHARREALRLRTRWLKFVFQVAPPIGMLGTILGIIHACQGEAAFRSSAFQAGFAEAVITTAAGFIVAIVAFAVFFAIEGSLEESPQEGEGRIE